MCSQVCRVFGQASRPVLFNQVLVSLSKLDHFQSISRASHLSRCVRELKVSGLKPHTGLGSFLLVKQISPLLSSFTGLQVFVFQGRDLYQPFHETDLEMLHNLLFSLESLRTTVPLTTIRLERCNLGPSTLADLLAFPVSVVLIASIIEGEESEGQNLVSEISPLASSQAKAHSLSIETHGMWLTKHIFSGAIDPSSLTRFQCTADMDIKEGLELIETLHEYAPRIADLHFRTAFNYVAFSVNDLPVETRMHCNEFKIPQWTHLRRLSIGTWTFAITSEPTPVEILARMVVFATRFLTSSLSNSSLFQCLELEIRQECLEPIPLPSSWSDMSHWFTLDDALDRIPHALLVIQFVGKYEQAIKSAENLTELCETGLPRLVRRKGLLIHKEIGSRNY
ncbi:hypothetical protein DL96DRAFT_841035 [Flagelloscypha sp. PMI_526]|nr:hypothetical protein DL96DRAFT_841035 [Flagelloscypha sp. PMI_526]